MYQSWRKKKVTEEKILATISYWRKLFLRPSNFKKEFADFLFRICSKYGLIGEILPDHRTPDWQKSKKTRFLNFWLKKSLDKSWQRNEKLLSYKRPSLSEDLGAKIKLFKYIEFWKTKDCWSFKTFSRKNSTRKFLEASITDENIYCDRFRCLWFKKKKNFWQIFQNKGVRFNCESNLGWSFKIVYRTL